MTSRVDTCLLMSKTVICVVYVDDCIFWARSKSEIDNVMRYFEEDGPSYNWEQSKGESVSDFLVLVSRHRMIADFSFFKPD